MTTGRISPGDKDTWWWNDEVKDAKRAYKKRPRRSGAHQERRKRETYIGKQPRRQRKK